MQKQVNASEEASKLSPKAKELLVYARIYRFFAFGLLLLGFIGCGVIYDKLSGGDFIALLKAPAYLLYLFMPFIPAVIMAFAAHRKLKKFYKQAEKDGYDINSLRKRSDLYSHRNVKK